MPLPTRLTTMVFAATLMAAGLLRAGETPASPRLGAPCPPPCAPANASAVDLDQPITVSGGLITGGFADERGDVRAFKGIPYAAPPIGPRRWRPPAPVADWDGVRACTAFGASCPQPPSSLVGDLGEQSEDCLFLNVWTPAERAYDRYPVMVWIHGGGFATGSASSDWYDGRHLARQGVVVVTINYRLGPFGFLAHPALSDESERGVSGNFGLLDQIAALEWVRDNIGALGGDPGRVTLFGESAGSASICTLMVSPLAKGLFHRAIAQSGGVHEDQRHLSQERNGLEPMEAIGRRIAKTLDCHRADDVAAALRAIDAKRLLAAAKPSLGLFGQGVRFGPVVDGWCVPYDPALMWADGKQARVPLMVGTNADEGRLFLRWFPPVGMDFYQGAVRKLFGGYAERVLGLYPAVDDSEVAERISGLITDTTFVMPARALVRAMDKIGSKAWMYRFTRVAPKLRDAGLGATHAAEIPYVFQTLTSEGYDQADRDLARTMAAMWVRFAANGDPNSADHPWPTYDRATDLHLELGDVIAACAGVRSEACDLFYQMWVERSHLAAGMNEQP